MRIDDLERSRFELWGGNAPAGKRYAGWMKGARTNGQETPIYVDEQRPPAAAVPAGTPPGEPPARSVALAAPAEDRPPSSAWRYDPDRMMRQAREQAMDKVGRGSFEATRIQLGEDNPWVRRMFARNQLLEKRSADLQKRTIDILLDEQKLRQGEGRFQMDLEENERKRGLLPYDVWEREQRIRKGAQEMEQSGTRFGWEQADRPMSQAERAQKMMRDQAAEGRARTGETRAAEEHEWNRNNPMKNPTAGTEPAPAVTTSAPATPAAAAPAQPGQAVDANTARTLLAEAGGDKAKARELAKARGFAF